MTDRDRFYDFLLRHLGIAYRWGGANPLTGYDCSGFAQIALGWLDLDPPGDQTAHGLYLYFKQRGTTVQLADLGYLVFYGSPARMTHVAVALDGERMFEFGGGDSRTTSRLIAEAQGACGRVSRIRRRADLAAIIRPDGLPW